MGSRLELHEKFCEILGNRNAYFQPPASVKLKYDAIVYSFKSFDIKHADDSKYGIYKCYEVTVIHRDPESDIPEKILKLPMCSFDRPYVADNLYHEVFTIYY